MPDVTNSVTPLQVRSYDRRDPGGQQVVETASGVSVFDRDRGIGVIVSTEKSQLRNRQIAEAYLAALIGEERLND